MSAAAREPAAHPRKPVASPDRASPSKKPFYVGPSNSAASAVAQAPSVAPKPTYITQRRAPRAQQPPTATDRDESRAAPYLRWDDPPSQTPGEAVTETAVGSLPPPSHRSGSPSAKFTVVPCVAHPVYTKHQNCGCLRSRSGSPTHKEPEQPKPKFRWDDLMPTPPTPALEPPPPPVFEAPQKLLNVKGLKHLRHVAATGGMAVLATESNGSVVQARHSVTGACLPDGEAHVAVPKQTDVPVTAMTTVDKHVWCGHLDGSIRIYNAEGMLFESVKHSGAVQCFVAFASERAVYAGSADWYISKWTQSSLTQWKSVMVGGHTLGVRALCEAVTPAATYLCSAGDDAELRIWLVASSAKNALSPGSPTAASPAPQQQTNTPTMTLKKHHGAVLSCLYAFDTLWSGGEDATVRRWSLSEKRQLAELKGHSSAVLSMHKVGTSVWTLGKDGLGIIFDGDTGAAVHTMAFFDPAAFSKSAHRLAAQLFYVQPVTGHVLWISDPAGETAAWYAPTETPEVEDASNNLLASRGGVAFEESERIVALYFEAEAAQRRLVDGLRVASEEYASGVNAAITDATAQLERHMTWLQSADRDALPPPPPPPVVVVAPPAESDLQLVQELRRQLKDALEKIAAFQSGDALQSDAVEELRTIALSMQSENRTLVGQLDAANARILDLETSLHAMQEAMHGDQFALNRRNSELETKLNDLRLELDSKDVEIAALRAALSQTEQPSAELLGLRSKLQAMEQEIERHVARGKESNAAAAAAAEQIDKLKKELQHREQLLDKLLLEKDSAVAKMSQQDVDAMTALANARTDIKRLQTELQKSQSYVEGLAADRDRFSKLAEQREAEIARLQALSRDRDREEVAVRQSYEGRIAELISRLAQYDDRSIDGKLNELNAANSDLRKKLGEFTSPRYVDLLNENSDLKRQLGEHREHITRLLQHDQRLEAMVRDLRERAAHAARDAFEAARRSQSPKAETMHHDMSSPHHRETCIWCSGAVNVSAGTTFGHKKGSPDRGAPQQRSRSRSPQVAAGDPLTTRRSGSAPEVLTVGPPPAASSPSSDPATTTHPSTARVSIRGLDLNGSPRTVERRKEKRVAQLKTATESTTNEAVKAALIDQILAIHQQVVGAPTAAARPTAANADGA